jgi:hypothetical protein
MPVHDWTRVSAGNFHHFHQRWIGDLAAALNTGGLPDEFEARAEPITGKYSPDVVALHTGGPPPRPGSVATAVRPTARQVLRVERINYARRKDRVVIRHQDGQVVAVIELVSPGNKDGQTAFRTFVEKAADVIHQGVSLLVVDLFPPTARDPQGVHKPIMDQFDEAQPFEFRPDKPLTVASYTYGAVLEAYVDTLGVGDPLPAAPLFLTPFDAVPCPLEDTYQQAAQVLPRSVKRALAGLPQEGN